MKIPLGPLDQLAALQGHRQLLVLPDQPLLLGPEPLLLGEPVGGHLQLGGQRLGPDRLDQVPEHPGGRRPLDQPRVRERADHHHRAGPDGQQLGRQRQPVGRCQSVGPAQPDVEQTTSGRSDPYSSAASAADPACPSTVCPSCSSWALSPSPTSVSSSTISARSRSGAAAADMAVAAPPPPPHAGRRVRSGVT
jgi:hypothetical protein